jgi:hypothetical protein
MNKSEKFTEDILSRYIDPGKIDKAPEGFTEKIMSRIQAEKVLSPASNRYFNNLKVPLISIMVTASFIISAILASPTDKDSAIFSILKPLSDIWKTFPVLNIDKLTSFNLPGWMIYVVLGIFMLTLFDRALNFFFHGERK